MTAVVQRGMAAARWLIHRFDQHNGRRKRASSRTTDRRGGGAHREQAGGGCRARREGVVDASDRTGCPRSSRGSRSPTTLRVYVGTLPGGRGCPSSSVTKQMHLEDHDGDPRVSASAISLEPVERAHGVLEAERASRGACITRRESRCGRPRTGAVRKDRAGQNSRTSSSCCRYAGSRTATAGSILPTTD